MLYERTACNNIFYAKTIRDISKSVTAIQNAGLGEFRIRDLNDHINKLLREKKHWENRIRELGGKSYSSKGANLQDLVIAWKTQVWLPEPLCVTTFIVNKRYPAVRQKNTAPTR